jgi:hypothetical protein
MVASIQMRALIQNSGRIALLLCVLAGFDCHAQTAPRITTFQKTGRLVWTNVIPGHYYAVQAKGSLSQTWTNLGGGLDNIQASNTTMSVTVPVGASQMFFTVQDRGSCCQNFGGVSLLTAVNLGTICGDQDAGVLSSSGCGDGWFRAHISECFSGFGFPDIRVRVTLQSPPGTDYDLYLYGTDGTLIGSSTSGTGVTDSIAVAHTDNFGADDSFDIIIEVRRYSAFPCTNWSLQVSGNVP